MKIALITGTGGLIGSECVSFLSDKFDLIVGIDNDMRKYFFGQPASTNWNVERLKERYPNYKHYSEDIRNKFQIEQIFRTFGTNISLIVHAAAQPSHDWAAKEPLTDFSVNATGTLIMLEMARLHSPEAVFIFTSTNKVYGDNPNKLPLVELEARWEIAEMHPYYTHGIDELMSIDHCKHSVFGASKAAADLMVQEYGRYFGMRVGVFRGGCLTGPNHSGAEMHGFLSYLMKCCVEKKPYTIFGYKGKQVRDNIHSYDLVNMFWNFYNGTAKHIVYNAGGGRHSCCSMLEAIAVCEEISGNKLNYTYTDQNRSGDHIWYVSDTCKFKRDHPGWEQTYSTEQILIDIFNNQHESIFSKTR